MKFNHLASQHNNNNISTKQTISAVFYISPCHHVYLTQSGYKIMQSKENVLLNANFQINSLIPRGD